MKIILEKMDVLQLLGDALGYEIREEDVVICNEPFEVHINTLRVNASLKPERPRVQEPSSPEPSFPTTYDDDGRDISQVLSQSERLAELLPSMKMDPDAKGINDFSRPLADNETEDPPGEDYLGEIGK